MSHSFSHTRRWPLWLALIGALVALGFSLASPLRYGSTMRVLITQPNAAGLDPYTAIKSTERIAANLSELIYTTTYFNNVLAQAQGFDASYFPTDEYQRRKLWKESVETQLVPGTGIMALSGFHPKRGQARILVDAAARELALETPNYFGYNVRVQVVDSPLDSPWFAKPRFLQNALIGALAGFLLGLGWILAKMGAKIGEWS